MTGGWDDYAAALKFRNLIEDIATTQAQKVMPADFTAQVVEIDVPNLTAAVKQAGDAGLLIAKFSPSLQPRTIGCFVRISGYPGNYYISAILDEAGINQVYEVTTQQALDAANQALTLISTDELPPTTAPVAVMTPLGYDGIVVKWNAVPNADPLKYRVLLDKVSPPVQVLTETVGLVVSTSQLPSGERLDPAQTYYAEVIPFDADGDGPASAIVSGGPVLVPANAVSMDVLVTNTFFSREAYFGNVSVNQLTTGNLTATVDITTGRLNIGTITIDQTNGIRIPLPDNGQIVFPKNGSDAIFEKVRIHATGATFDGNVDIQGQNNTLTGRLLLVGTVPPPRLAPLTQSVFDPAPVVFTDPAAYAGFGDNGTYWQSAATTAYDGNSGIVTLGIFSFDKTNGTRPTYYQVQADFYNVGTSYTRDDGAGREGEHYYTDFSYGPAPSPQIMSFHSTATVSVTSYYLPAYTYQTRVRVVGGMNPSTGPWATYTAQTARYHIIVTNNSTGALVGHFYWSEFSSWYNPVVFTDGTYVYVAACYKGGNQTNVYRYTTTGGDANTAPFPYVFSNLWGVNYTGMWLGNADFGEQRFIFHTSDTLYMVNSTGTVMSSEMWALPEYTRGVVYSAGRFYMHGGASRVWKCSPAKSSVAHTAKYTWYDAIGTVHESTASPSVSTTQNARMYLQVITQPAPNGGAPDDPSTVRIYIDAHRQADVPAGTTTVIYEVPSTANPDAPLIDGFSSIGGHGAFESSLKSPARVQQITITGAPTGGSFTLQYGGTSTAAIAFNATAATVQTTINNLLASIGGGTVIVGGGPGPGTPWLVSFSSSSPLQLGATSNLSGGLAPTVAITGGVPVTSFTGDGSWHLSSMTGAVLPYAGPLAPDGFLMCNGQAVSRLTYADLYRVIGTTYGAGDGSTTFNVPDLRGRTVVGTNPMGGVTRGAGDLEFDTLGEPGGHKSMQAHSHGGGTGWVSSGHTHNLAGTNNFMRYVGAGAGNVNVTFGGNDASAGQAASPTGDINQNHWHGITTDGSGDSGNLQPYITLNYLIKT